MLTNNNWSNITLISDGFNNNYWNNGSSTSPSIATGEDGSIHVVWGDSTDGEWGTDTEIMYAKYVPDVGWSNATVISDGYYGDYWNDDFSLNPDISIGSNGSIHVVWSDYTNSSLWGDDREIMYVRYNPELGWSNITVISDDISKWNNDSSDYPQIEVDNNDTVHVVWEDDTDGEWGYDSEIFYTSYMEGFGWSNISVISDGYNGVYWNDGWSSKPSLALDGNGGISVVWHDITEGVWGWDHEIMYGNYISSLGWSNVTVISDGYNGSYWNTGDSYTPSIDIDMSGTIHVVWRDSTEGPWGKYPDYEIMYVNFTAGIGWTNATVISDGYNGNYWNNGSSRNPIIKVDNNCCPHVIWHDYTNGEWGDDPEIMYVNRTDRGWSNATVISDGYEGNYWNDGASMYPDMEIGIHGEFNIVWHDTTEGIWGSDYEIMFINSSYTLEPPEQNFPPNPPTLYLITNVESEIYLNWSNVPNATKYYIYRDLKEILDINSLNPIAISINSSHMDSVIDSNTYYYAIVAGNDYGNSSLSNCENITIEIYTSPNPFDGIWIYIIVVPIAIGTILLLLIIVKKRERGRKS